MLYSQRYNSKTIINNANEFRILSFLGQIKNSVVTGTAVALRIHSFKKFFFLIIE